MKHTTTHLTININDIITPISCAKMVIELVKYIAYQKELIPYPYERLKLYVNKQKEYFTRDHQYVSKGQQTAISSQMLLTLNKCFKATQGAYDSLENIFTHITDEITYDTCDRLEEIIILLGSTILSPQDIFRIQIPHLDLAHSDKYHSMRKNHEWLYKSIFESDKFHSLVSKNICTSNLYVLFKMKSDALVQPHLFIPRHNFELPMKGQHAVISFKASVDNNFECCCLGMKVFNDSSNDTYYYSSSVDNSNNDTGNNNDKFTVPPCEGVQISKWYQIKTPVKRFVDTKVSGVSVANIWLNPQLINNL